MPLENARVDTAVHRDPLNAWDIRNSLKALMWCADGVVRDGAGLDEAAEDIERWCSYVLPRQFNEKSGWELQNMLMCARLMIQAAQLRKETRGVHDRSDYPTTDDANWRKHIAFRWETEE
ncbi:MAG: hypothetical protein QM811_08880 [Pirellulales bacterium]